jgi:hypothetical protein
MMVLFFMQLKSRIDSKIFSFDNTAGLTSINFYNNPLYMLQKRTIFNRAKFSAAQIVREFEDHSVPWSRIQLPGNSLLHQLQVWNKDFPLMFLLLLDRN